MIPGSCSYRICATAISGTQFTLPRTYHQARLGGQDPRQLQLQDLSHRLGRREDDHAQECGQQAQHAAAQKVAASCAQKKKGEGRSGRSGIGEKSGQGEDTV